MLIIELEASSYFLASSIDTLYQAIPKSSFFGLYI